MNVLYVIDSLGGGGAESSLASLAPRLIEAGVRLEVVPLKRGGMLHEQLTEAGAAVHSLENRKGRVGRTIALGQLIRRSRPDLIHTTLFEADLAGRVAAAMTRTPVVSSLVNDSYGPGHVGSPGLRVWKIRAAQSLDWTTGRWVRRWHAISDHVATTMSRRLRIPANKIEVIPRGRDPGALGIRTPSRRDTARTKLQIAEGKLIVAIARHEWQKGLDILIESIPHVTDRHPEAKLIIAGRHGNQTGHLKHRIAELELHEKVRVIGERNDIPDLLCAADAFVFPSRWEGLGSTLLEAMALEAPIVASDLPAIRETVGGSSNACLVPPEDPHALARGLLRILSDRQSSQVQAERARLRFLDRFTIEPIARTTLGFYERALDRRGRSSATLPE